MKKIYALLLFTAFSLNSFAQKTWLADPNHSQLSFDITHLTISSVEGSFTDFDAHIVSDKGDFSDASIEMSANMESINTQVAARDKHLRSEDFFDVENYPKMYYKSTSIRKDGKEKGRYVANGYLTMHGIVKPLELKIWFRGIIENPSNKEKVAGFQVTGTLLRSDYKVGEKFPEAMLSDKVMLKADLEFSEKK